MIDLLRKYTRDELHALLCPMCDQTLDWNQEEGIGSCYQCILEIAHQYKVFRTARIGQLSSLTIGKGRGAIYIGVYKDGTTSIFIDNKLISHRLTSISRSTLLNLHKLALLI